MKIPHATFKAKHKLMDSLQVIILLITSLFSREETDFLDWLWIIFDKNPLFFGTFRFALVATFVRLVDSNGYHGVSFTVFFFFLSNKLYIYSCEPKNVYINEIIFLNFHEVLLFCFLRHKKYKKAFCIFL